ncbi:hypothetical protein HK102_001282 [Quaeritorhiza haematococci]|nr:hypothetical protein HK102_001282 [Quaeritorhiza haematococci]
MEKSFALAAVHLPKPHRTSGVSLTSRLNVSCTKVGKKVYAFGGFHLYTSEVYRDLYELSLDDFSWRPVDHVKGNWPCPRNGHSATLWNNDRLIIFGGFDDNDNALNDLNILNLANLTWEKPVVHGTVPAGRAKHSAVIHDNKLYITGGSGGDAKVHDDLCVLDLETFVWDIPRKFVVRSSHASFVYRDCLYVYGGMNQDLDRPTEIANINLVDMVPTRLTSVCEEAPTPLGQHFVQVCGKRLVVVVTQCLKHGARTLPTGIWTLDLDTLRWRRHDDGKYLDTGSWYYHALNHDSNQFLLLGARDWESDEYLSSVLSIDLESYGIVNVPPPSLGMNFAPLLESAEFSDFSIICSGENEGEIASQDPIKVHKLVLFARWPHFAAMCRSGMSEAASGTMTIPESRATVEAFVRYLYTDTLNDIPPEIVADLLVLANMYCLDRLQKLCTDILHRNITVGTVAKIFQQASKANEICLKRRAVAYILDRFGEICRTVSFRNLPPAVLAELWDAMPEDARVQVQQSKFQ